MGSRVHGLRSCSSPPLEHRFNSRGAQAELLHSMWGLPNKGTNPCLLDSSPLSHQGSPQYSRVNTAFNKYLLSENRVKIITNETCPALPFLSPHPLPSQLLSCSIPSAQRDLEGIMLSELSLGKRNLYNVTSMWNLKKGKLTETESRLVVTKAEGVEDGNAGQMPQVHVYTSNTNFQL